MRLTKSDKDAFILAVVQDIPKIDYQEQYRKLVLEDSISQLPAKLQPLARDKTLSAYLRVGNYWSHHQFCSAAVFEMRGTNFTLSEAARTKLDEMAELSKAQDERLAQARAKLRGAIEPCNTLKVALERLPEFEQYLPKQQEKSVYLPSIANLCADLATLGWPKNKAAPVQAEKPTKKKAAMIKAGAGTVIAL